MIVLLLINAFQAFDEFYNLLSNAAGSYPPYARPPLVYLYYVALGRQQDFGHGSAGAVILTVIIATFTHRPRPPVRLRTARVLWLRCVPPVRGPSPGTAALYGVLIVAAILFLIPFYLLVRNGLSTDLEISAPDWKLFPSSLQFGNVTDLFDNRSVPFLRSLRNSAIVSVLQTTGAVLVASMAGYGLARIPYRYAKVVFVTILVTLMIPAAVTFVPSFIIVVGDRLAQHATRD